MDEIAVDEALVRGMLREQHPDLAELAIREVVGGWDNQMWRLGSEYAVRIPRTPRAPSLLEKELRWLPLLADRLPLPTPVPLRAGHASGLFPKPWHVVRWVEGEPADRSPIERVESAEVLAGFLKALHVAAPADAPVSPERSVGLSELVDGFEHGLREFGDHGEPAVAGAVRAVWDAGVAAPGWEGPLVWLHTDLHPANVLVTGGSLSGVIDFGDLCAGDPATDLAAAWLLLPEGAAGRFFESYGAVDDAMMRRALAWAAYRALGLISIGLAGDRGRRGGKPTWGPAGRAALTRVLAHAAH
ncbi:aminoglycoside phosphotransferase family protein [Kribbella sp. NPDC056861]|uniref:aminoglycoside phosphotransferase family protein n=1 Tax=Kribbella sp. NPDC056861 TaxID=3154857 RepID=UPI003443DCAC